MSNLMCGKCGGDFKVCEHGPLTKRCGHCGGNQLDIEREDGDIYCINCGWREPPERGPDLPKRTAGVDRR